MKNEYTMYDIVKAIAKTYFIEIYSEVATDVVKKLLLKHVDNDVYASYEPKQYHRRMNNGGLRQSVQDAIINFKINEKTGELFLILEMRAEFKKLSYSDEDDNSYYSAFNHNLAYIISGIDSNNPSVVRETGIQLNKYQKLKYGNTPYAAPAKRAFIQNAINEFKSDPIRDKIKKEVISKINSKIKKEYMGVVHAAQEKTNGYSDLIKNPREFIRIYKNYDQDKNKK